MGRYLATGIMTRFSIIGRKRMFYDKDFKLEKEIDNILNDINKIIDPSLYKLTNKDDECYEFSLKPDIFDNNIHELIREISPLTYPNVDFFADFYNEKENLNNNDFIKNYPFACKVNSKGEYCIEINGEEIKEDYPFYPLYWIINDERLFYNVEIRAATILLWIDQDKYDGEDETEMLRIINNMKTKYYNSVLSKALIYYITG